MNNINLTSSVNHDIKTAKTQPLPTTEISSAKCTFCFNSLSVKSVVTLECSHKAKHVFHESCLSKWVNTSDQECHRSCPICRAPIDERIIANLPLDLEQKLCKAIHKVKTCECDYDRTILNETALLFAQGTAPSKAHLLKLMSNMLRFENCYYALNIVEILGCDMQIKLPKTELDNRIIYYLHSTSYHQESWVELLYKLGARYHTQRQLKALFFETIQNPHIDYEFANLFFRLGLKLTQKELNEALYEFSNKHVDFGNEIIQLLYDKGGVLSVIQLNEILVNLVTKTNNCNAFMIDERLRFLIKLGVTKTQLEHAATLVMSKITYNSRINVGGVYKSLYYVVLKMFLDMGMSFSRQKLFTIMRLNVKHIYPHTVEVLELLFTQDSYLTKSKVQKLKNIALKTASITEGYDNVIAFLNRKLDELNTK